MTEKTMYVCDICGKEYEYCDDAVDCEIKHITEGANSNVKLFDFSWNEIPLEDFFLYDSIYYFWVKNNEGQEALERLFEHYCIEPPFDAYDRTGFFYWDEDSGIWANTEGVKEELDNLERQFLEKIGE